jgi:hypothetical protein
MLNIVTALAYVMGLVIVAGLADRHGSIRIPQDITLAPPFEES